MVGCAIVAMSAITSNTDHFGRHHFTWSWNLSCELVFVSAIRINWCLVAKEAADCYLKSGTQHDFRRIDGRCGDESSFPSGGVADDSKDNLQSAPSTHRKGMIGAYSEFDEQRFWTINGNASLKRTVDKTRTHLNQERRGEHSSYPEEIPRGWKTSA